jgi:hypothetical protein
MFAGGDRAPDRLQLVHSAYGCDQREEVVGARYVAYRESKDITCRPIGKFFMFIVTKLSSTLILYL